MKFLAWDEQCSEEEFARGIEADTAEEAAEEYAEREFNSGDFFESTTVCLVGPDGARYRMEVTVESIPHFSAAALGEVAGHE